MRLGILASHPIQYQAPWFRGLAQVADVTVFFAHRQTAAGQADAGFGVAFDWDIDLLACYRHMFLRNIASVPSVNEYGGCDTPEIAEIIPREKFDAFIVNGWYLKSFLQAAAACRRARTPVFIRGDSQFGMSPSLLKRAVKELTHRILLRRFDGFLYVGRHNAEYLAHYGAPKERMFFVPHFVDNAWFASRAAEALPQRDTLRASWGVTPDSVVALFVGKFVEKKRPSDLLQALGAGKNPRTMAVFVGSGELEQSLREEANALGVKVHFAGFKNQSELPGLYASADVLVLPSNAGETWGLVVNEAMACGLPAIVSDAVGCVPDLIEEHQTGFSFPLGNAHALMERLSVVKQKKQTGHDWRPALQAKLQTYSLETAVTGTMRAIDTVISDSQRSFSQ
jgi:glycosyltransferase involved in cell wall biosynthesis